MASEYDIIFAGGGTCACVTAGRLAAAAPDLKILIIEAGKNTKGLAEHIQPARYLSHLSSTSTTVTFHRSQPVESLDGRSVIVPIGHSVGGGSTVNFAMYTRAAASDYDDWEKVHENPGWGSKDLIPLAEKLETYQIAQEQPTHGSSGPIKVSYGGYYTNVGKEFLDVASKYDTTRSVTEDVNDFYHCNAYGRWPKYIDQITGKRSDAAHHYIYNQEHNKNIFVMDEARVKRVIFEDDRAVGVEYVKELPAGVSFVEVELVHTVRASKLVVIAAGALGSPGILERSGIGSASLVQSLDVQCRVDLPGVGENYQASWHSDHNLGLFVMKAADEAETLDVIFSGKESEELNGLIAQWDKSGTGLMANNAVDSGIKMRPDEKDLEVLGPEFKERWETYHIPAPDKPVLWLGPMSAFLGDPSAAPAGKCYSMLYYTEYPVALGYAHISSGQNAHAPLKFNPYYLDNGADIAVVRWGYKKARELGRRMPLFKGEPPLSHPNFKVGSQAECLAQKDGPFSISDPNIVYTVEDDNAIDEYHRKFIATTWHSMGTCAMKPREKGGVVDSSLNVYGIKGLKVADLSICPSNVSANTYNTALIVGEKAAVIIGAELGINY